MSDEGESNGWREYQKLVLSELRRLDSNVEKLGDRVDRAVKHERANRQMAEAALVADTQRLSLEVHALKIKCGVYATIGASIPVIAALVLKQL